MTDSKLIEAVEAVQFCIATIRNSRIPPEDNCIWSVGTSSKPRITLPVLEQCEAALRALIRQHEPQSSPSWKPISEYKSGIVRLWASHVYNVQDVIGYQSLDEFFVLNHNECEEGSELLQWKPTHFQELSSSPSDSGRESQGAGESTLRNAAAEVRNLYWSCKGGDPSIEQTMEALRPYISPKRESL